MALSPDLRERVVGAVVEDGMSRNAAAKRYGSAAPAPRAGWPIQSQRRDLAGRRSARGKNERRSDPISAHFCSATTPTTASSFMLAASAPVCRERCCRFTPPSGPFGARKFAPAQDPLARTPPNRSGDELLGVEPELVAEITYLTWTADGLLRHTIYVGSAQARNSGSSERLPRGSDCFGRNAQVAALSGPAAPLRSMS